MGYLTTSGALQLLYPDGAEDLDIPGDIGQLAIQVDDGVTTLINDNVVQNAVLHVNELENKVEVIDGVMHIYLIPPDISTKYDKAGGTISGNLVVTGTSNLQGAVTVPTPTLAAHAAPKSYVDLIGAVGLVAPFYVLNPPPGWYLCDGSPHNNAALLAATGDANTPDMRGMLPIGSTGATGNYVLGQEYGAASVTLTQNELPAHTHTINSTDISHSHTATTATGGGSKTPAGSISSTSTNHYHSGTSGTESSNHSHSGTTGYMNQNWSHAHTGWFWEGDTAAGDNSNQPAWIDTADATQGSRKYVAIDATDTNHTHSFSTGGISANHTHSLTTGYMSANSSHGHTFTGSALNIDHSHSTTIASGGGSHSHSATSTGTGNAFSILPPSVALRFFIFGGL